MADELSQRKVDLEKRVDTFIHLKERAIGLIDKMNKVEKTHKDGSTEKQFRMLVSFLWENGIWDDRIDFDIKPDSSYFEADDYLPIETLTQGDGYEVNFERIDRSSKNMKSSNYVVSEADDELISLYNEKLSSEINLGKFLKGELSLVEKRVVSGAEDMILEECIKLKKEGKNLKKINLAFEAVVPFRQLGILDYAVRVFDEIDSSYFTGTDLLKRIVGIYLLFKAQEGEIEPRKKILAILRMYFNKVAKNAFNEWALEGFGKTIQLDDIQTLTFDEAVRKIMQKVLFGDNFKDLGKLLKLIKEKHELPLAGEEIINKKIMVGLVRRFKNGFLDYLESVDYESKKLQVILDYELFKAGKLKFEDIEMDIVKTYFPILSTGLSPIEAIGSFFNEKMFKKGDYFKKLVYWFKSELINWIKHRSNPLELAELEKIKKVSLESRVSFSQKDERKVQDILGTDEILFSDKMTKMDLFLIKKRLLRKAKTDFQKNKVERDFKILKLNLDGYSDEEISDKIGIGRRTVFKAREQLRNKIKSYLA